MANVQEEIKDSKAGLIANIIGAITIGLTGFDGGMLK